jgi:hypothetical protein
MSRRQKSAEKIQIPCPEIIITYNKIMGGVDLKDQKKITYEIDRKAKIKYYLQIFFDLMDIAVNNTNCIFTQLNQNVNPEYKAISPLQYRQLIARFLIGNYTNRKRRLPARPVRSSKNTIPAPQPEHKLVKKAKWKRCAECAKDKIENRTDNMCEICQVHLCYTTSRNCFEKYHTQGALQSNEDELCAYKCPDFVLLSLFYILLLFERHIVGYNNIIISL